MSDTKIRFWGGLRTIGGTIVTIEYKGSRVMFDFGLVYSPATQIFDGQLKSRETALVRDYLKLGAIPKMDGIYAQEDLEGYSDLVSAEESDLNTAVIISHLHLDHIGAMGLLASEIPIYLSEESFKLYNALRTIGEGVMGDTGRDYKTCSFNQSFRIGAIQITPIQIDHDIPGACGFHIQTPDGALVYTGDLRFHGKHPERTHNFIQEVRRLGLDVLITEGTTLRDSEELLDEAIFADSSLPEEMVTEQNIPEKLVALFKETEGLAIFNPYHRNMDRLNGMIEAAHAAGREPVFDPETAYLADLFLNDQSFCVFTSSETLNQLDEGKVPDWLKRVLEQRNSVTADEINQFPGHYALQNNYENSLDLFDLNLEKGLYIHSNGVPLGPFDPAFDNLDRILKMLNLEKVSLLAGGHGIPTNLKYFVDEIDPPTLVPLHSFYPERLKPKSGKQLLPEYGVTYLLKNHTLINHEVVES